MPVLIQLIFCIYQLSSNINKDKQFLAYQMLKEEDISISIRESAGFLEDLGIS